ncbi:MAG: hypothetical protein PVI66_05975 [Candidatus Aminicenantes bacterium]
MRHRKIFRFSSMVFLLLLFSLIMADRAVAAEEDVFADPESLVRGLYAAVTFDVGSDPDWDYVRKFFIPEAVIAVRMTRTSMAILNVEEFLKWFDDDFKKYKMKERGFEETIEKIKLTVFGDMAHCFVVYKARLKTPEDSPGQLGLDSWGLMKKDGRWWIVSVSNDVVTPQRPLPEELRK